MSELIRQLASRGEVFLTQHAADEANEEAISVDEVIEVLMTGSVLEDYPDHIRGACCLLYGVTTAGRNLHVVVTTTKSPLRIITVYIPVPPYWISPTQRGRRTS